MHPIQTPVRTNTTHPVQASLHRPLERYSFPWPELPSSTDSTKPPCCPTHALRKESQTRPPEPAHAYAAATYPCQGTQPRRIHPHTRKDALATPPTTREKDIKRTQHRRHQRAPQTQIPASMGAMPTSTKTRVQESRSGTAPALPPQKATFGSDAVRCRAIPHPSHGLMSQLHAHPHTIHALNQLPNTIHTWRMHAHEPETQVVPSSKHAMADI